jgi:methyl-accepting chemotaxis protein
VVAIVLLIVFGVVAFQALNTQGSALREIKETRMENSRRSAELAGRLAKVHVQLFGLVTWFSAYDKATQDRLIAETPKALTALVTDVQAQAAEPHQNSEEKQKLGEILALLDKYRKDMDAAINMVQLDVTSALGDMKTVSAHFAALEKAFDDLSALERRLADETYAGAQKQASVALSINIFVLLSAIAVAGTLGYLTARRLLAQLGGEPALAVEVALRVARGDLTAEIPKAPSGSLIDSMSTMRDGLRGTISRMAHNSGALSTAAEQLAAASDQVAKRSGEQNDAAASMAAAIEELSVSINSVADNAKLTAATSEHSGATAQEGAGIVLEAATEMENIAQSVSDVASAIKALGEHADRISSVVTVISEVAAQTNLLALNAAIEAARAGEQGRGFAVVADEVRKLAERTTSSTAEIRQMISEIQSSSTTAMNAMSVAGRRVGSGVDLARRAGDAIRRIETEATEVLAAVNEISASLREQGTVTGDAARHVEEIARGADDNARMAAQSAAAASALGTLAGSMRQDVEHFRV